MLGPANHRGRHFRASTDRACGKNWKIGRSPAVRDRDDGRSAQRCRVLGTVGDIHSEGFHRSWSVTSVRDLPPQIHCLPWLAAQGVRRGPSKCLIFKIVWQFPWLVAPPLIEMEVHAVCSVGPPEASENWNLSLREAIREDLRKLPGKREKKLSLQISRRPSRDA